MVQLHVQPGPVAKPHASMTCIRGLACRHAVPLLRQPLALQGLVRPFLRFAAHHISGQ